MVPVAQAVEARDAATWRELLRAMGVSAAGAMGSGLLSAAASKIVAVMLGPAALAVLATLQQIRQTALTTGTCNGQTALIQGASSQSGTARRQYLRSVALIFLTATLLSAAVLALAPGVVAQWAGLSSGMLIRSLAPVVILSSLFVFLAAMLNATGAVTKVALVQLAGPAAMALGAWRVRDASQLSALLGFSAAAAAVCAAVALRGELPRDWLRGIGRFWSPSAARHFFSISGAMLATGLAGSAALITVRAGILRGQGLAATGQFDAAWNISMNQVTLVLASIQAYYLPALARLADPSQRAQQIGRVLAAAAPACAAVTAVIALSKPLLLRLLYSGAFLEAGHYLRWTLLGDYLKVTSWILSVPMLAVADMRIFVAADLAAALAFLGSAAALSHMRAPAEAAAIAFVAMHLVHLMICAVYVRSRHAFRWQGRPAAAWLAGAAAVGAASAIGWSW